MFSRSASPTPLILGLVCLASASAAAVEAVESVTIRDDNGNGSFFSVDFENNYLPNVVLRENGAASFEALKAQAVAARTFAYYKLETGSSFIRNSQADQVYSLGGARSNPGGRWDAAVAETEGEFLSFDGITTASFYVAGAIPSSPTGFASPSDPDPTNTQRFVTYPRADNLAGPNNRGSSLGFRGTVSNPNYPNRGAMSQNGADVLSDEGVHYADILKTFYGGDIQLGVASQTRGQTPFGEKKLATFERNDETFVRPLTFAGQARNLGGGTSVARTAARATTPGGISQELVIDYDPVADAADGGVDGFFVRHLSGASLSQRLTALTSGTVINPAADPVGNVILPTTGTIGFSLLAEPDPAALPGAAAGLEVALAIDDFGDDSILGSTTEQSFFQPVVADGTWRRYEWSLEDAAFASAFGAAGDGVLGSRFTLDSILLRGFGDATVYLDDVFFDATGVVIPEPTALVALLLAGAAAGSRRRRRGLISPAG
ncbi:SpoIID/LytB domain-containing protein [Phycisphaera mikurensis]|uniref:Sporulation stage II protein D amidase enhancer LytB N-terminal domain-containing protein n=1 Tax=Phycisphaera mikurensis (strain NBRC 102666 / KCTC 22515 / FYK2301M01) TaxID=1142394 RepID=I0IDW0_PHYMF|nr:SpoIID/LytB domain-containing protein [Phycisphaera mikurensis]MBB6441255.1 hypothetical protein [Phycisphaera mikurensis]BAM03448.1 hypothetical protein PSMK_12890 [Phycisphaera mikurensis NBRC 102666]